MEAIATKKGISTYEGKFLTFVLNKEVYGIEILKVREIICLMNITKAPQTQDYLKGVINLRGKVISIIDLRLKFSMPEAEHTRETCIIVTDVGANVRLRLWEGQGRSPLQAGVIVDSVSEVMDIESGEIEDTPNFGKDIDTKFIMGLGKAKDKIIILLDIKKVLSSEELKMVEQVAEK